MLLHPQGKLPVENTAPKNYIILNTDYAKPNNVFALPVDSVPTIFRSHIGKSSKAAGISQEFVRECWQCEEGRQMVFLDYEKLV